MCVCHIRISARAEIYKMMGYELVDKNSIPTNCTIFSPHTGLDFISDYLRFHYVQGNISQGQNSRSVKTVMHLHLVLSVELCLHDVVSEHKVFFCLHTYRINIYIYIYHDYLMNNRDYITSMIMRLMNMEQLMDNNEKWGKPGIQVGRTVILIGFSSFSHQANIQTIS